MAVRLPSTTRGRNALAICLFGGGVLALFVFPAFFAVPTCTLFFARSVSHVEGYFAEDDLELGVFVGGGEFYFESIGTPTPTREAKPGTAEDRRKAGAGHRGRTTSPRGKPTFLAVDDLEERDVALAEADSVDVGVIAEELGTERSGVRSADGNVRVRVSPLDDLGDELHAASIRGPAGHAPQLGVELGDDLLDAVPRLRREVDDLDLVPGADRLRTEREEAVGRLVEVGVEVALLVVGRRPVFAVHALRLIRPRDLPRRRVDEGDAHGRIIAQSSSPRKAGRHRKSGDGQRARARSHPGVGAGDRRHVFDPAGGRDAWDCAGEGPPARSASVVCAVTADVSAVAKLVNRRRNRGTGTRRPNDLPHSAVADFVVAEEAQHGRAAWLHVAVVTGLALGRASRSGRRELERAPVPRLVRVDIVAPVDAGACIADVAAPGCVSPAIRDRPRLRIQARTAAAVHAPRDERDGDDSDPAPIRGQSIYAASLSVLVSRLNFISNSSGLT